MAPGGGVVVAPLRSGRYLLRCRLHFLEVDYIVDTTPPNVIRHEGQIGADPSLHGGTINGYCLYHILFHPRAGALKPHKTFIDCGSGSALMCNKVSVLVSFTRNE